MKQNLATIFFSFLILPAISQEAKWDSTFRPNNYATKIEQFRGYPNAVTDIIFLGNSITAGTDWMELLGEPNARNRGISGDITFGILERLHEVTEGKPSKVFILIGINDISRNIPDSVILSNYQKIIQRIKVASPATKIYVQTLLPVNNEFIQFKNHYNKDEHILYINAELKKMAEKEKTILIDLYPHFLNADKKLDKQYTLDGLHFTPAGYKKWASILKQGKYINQ
jgi:lysophospholipase L1-like esterase